MSTDIVRRRRRPVVAAGAAGRSHGMIGQDGCGKKTRFILVWIVIWAD
jgi:hypothetical protein